MADFNFTLDDLASQDPVPFVRENMKGLAAPLKSSRSLTGATDFDSYTNLSTLSTGQILMGTPIYGDPAAVDSKQEALISSYLGSTLGKTDKSKAGLGVFDVLLPTDIANTASQVTGGGPAPPASAGNGAVGSATAVGSASITLPNTGTKMAADFVTFCLGEAGRHYVWGAVGPDTFDCSGLVLWALGKVGIVFPHFTGSQYGVVLAAKLNISVAQGLTTRGALLFNSTPTVAAGEHVAVSLGDGHSTIQGLNTQSGVLVVDKMSFDLAGLVPGLNYSTAVASPLSIPGSLKQN